jgi:hypothetical protein
VNIRTYFDDFRVHDQRPKTLECWLDNGVGSKQHWVARRADKGGRLTHIKPAPFNTGVFHARLLLMQPDCVATSWKELRTVDDTVYETYAEAAKKRGLLNDHTAAQRTLVECVNTTLTTPVRARVLLLAVESRAGFFAASLQQDH